MNLIWRFRTQVPYSELTAVVDEDSGEFSAIITGEIVDAPRAGDSVVPEPDNQKQTVWPYDTARAVTGGIEVARRGKNRK